MITRSSTGELLNALEHARDVSLTAYTLPAGRVLDGLTRAALSGAHVRVRLEGYIYKDDGTVGQANTDAIARLRRAGADAELVHVDADASDAMLHAKAAVVDDALFLDDRNWPDDGEDTIVRDDFARDAAMVRDAIDGREDLPTPYFSMTKRASLASEARLLNEGRRGDDVIVETESFGAGNRVFSAIDALARRGAHVRLLINARELSGNVNEQAAIDRLRRDGVLVRATDADEKFAFVNGAHGWIGSTNATVAFDQPDQLDWGARTNAPDVAAKLTQTFEERWGKSACALASVVEPTSSAGTPRTSATLAAVSVT